MAFIKTNIAEQCWTTEVNLITIFPEVKEATERRKIIFYRGFDDSDPISRGFFSFLLLSISRVFTVAFEAL